MNKILDAIKCMNCNKILSSPVLLHCEHSICKQHVNESKTRVIICQRCGHENQIPKNGFPGVQALKDIIDTQIHKLSFGKVHDDAKKLCTELEYALRDVTVLINDPQHYVNESLAPLKNEVFIKRELLKNTIDEETENLIRKLESLNGASSLKMANNKSVKNSKKIQELKIQVSAKLKSWQALLDSFEFDPEKYSSIIDECGRLTKELNENMESFKRSLISDNVQEVQSHVEYFTSIQLLGVFE